MIKHVQIEIYKQNSAFLLDHAIKENVSADFAIHASRTSFPFIYQQRSKNKVDRN